MAVQISQATYDEIVALQQYHLLIVTIKDAEQSAAAALRDQAQELADYYALVIADLEVET